MKPQIKARAIVLRKKGWSFKEISRYLLLPVSTIYVWSHKLKLGKKAKHRIELRGVNGRQKGRENRLRNIKKLEEKKFEIIVNKLKSFTIDTLMAKIICSLLYECEGSKRQSKLTFSNSDPALVRFYLSLLRRGFNIKETKLKALIHLHEYHDDTTQKLFWSRVTGIPVNQFHKSYLKPHTGKNKREGYPGCIHITYSDRWLRFEINTIIKYIIQNVGA